MSTNTDRSGRTTARERMAELRRRLEAADGSSREQLIAEFAQRWGAGELVVKYLRKAGRRVRNTGGPAELRRRMTLVRARLLAGAPTMRIAAELAPAFGVSPCVVARYAKAVRAEIDAELAGVGAPPLPWRSDKSSARGRVRQRRLALVARWMRRGMTARDAAARAAAEFGVGIRTGRSYVAAVRTPRGWMARGRGSASHNVRFRRLRKEFLRFHQAQAALDRFEKTLTPPEPIPERFEEIFARLKAEAP